MLVANTFQKKIRSRLGFGINISEIPESENDVANVKYVKAHVGFCKIY